MSSDYEQSDEFRRTLNESARLLSQNRPDEAVEMLRELSKLAPGNVDVAINLGGAYILQRKWSRAVRVLRKALEHHSENAMLWANLGAAELGQMELSGPKQQAKAIAAYERALQADPSAPNVHYHLGLIYKHRGELNRASAFFQRALEVRPEDRDAAYWLGRMRDLAEQQNSSGSHIDEHANKRPASTGRLRSRKQNASTNGYHTGDLPPKLPGAPSDTQLN
jgi:tetratricopeptide (TPR) repeat protein